VSSDFQVCRSGFSAFGGRQWRMRNPTSADRHSFRFHFTP